MTEGAPGSIFSFFPGMARALKIAVRKQAGKSACLPEELPDNLSEINQFPVLY
jgi:hypothetical protein